MPEATADASPPLDPAGLSPGPSGLSVSPNSRFPVCTASPNSGQFALPSSTAPAAHSRSTAVAPHAGTWSRRIRLPAVDRTPRVAIRSLTVNGTPASGPGMAPAAIAESMLAACSRASSSASVTMAFSVGF